MVNLILCYVIAILLFPELQSLILQSRLRGNLDPFQSERTVENYDYGSLCFPEASFRFYGPFALFVAFFSC